MIKDFVQLSPETVAAAATTGGLTTAQFSPQESSKGMIQPPP